MKPCEHCGQAKNKHNKHGRGRQARLLCAVGADRTYSQSKASFDRDFARYCERTGPQEAPEWFMDLKPEPSQSYSYAISTTYGLLDVTFYDTWVATRFNDSDSTELLTGSSLTGKWNFHGDNCRERFRVRLFNILLD